MTYICTKEVIDKDTFTLTNNIKGEYAYMITNVHLLLHMPTSTIEIIFPGMQVAGQTALIWQSSDVTLDANAYPDYLLEFRQQLGINEDQ
jgi:hypothetical protein